MIRGSSSVLRAWAAALLTVVAACPATAAAQSEDVGRWVHRAWTLRQGLPQSSIYAIEQTRDGYLWIGTLQGLVRFDGSRFTHFEAETTEGLQGNRIVGLEETNDGSLWIATQAHGLSRYREGAFRSYTIADGLPSNAVGLAGTLERSPSGGLWVGTDRGLARFEQDSEGGPGRFVVVGSHAGLPAGMATAIHADPDGTLWVGTAVGLAYRSAGAKDWLVLGTDAGLPSGVIGSITRRPNGDLWLGGTAGVSRLDTASMTFEHHPVDGDVVSGLLEDRRGVLWAVSAGAGLLRFDGSGFVSEAAAAAEIGRLAVHLYEDNEGHLWVGTNGNGLHRLKRSVFGAHAAAPDGLAGPMTHGLIETEAGDVWAATYASGLMRIRRDGEVVMYGEDAGVPSPTVWSLAETRDGTLWVGTETGLVRLVPGQDRFQRVRTPGARPLERRRIASLAIDDEGRLLAGTFLTHFARLTPSSGTEVEAELLLAPEMVDQGGGIIAVLPASDGSVWLGTQAAGIVQITPTETRFYAEGEGLPPAAIRTLVERSDGSIWAGTYGSGVCMAEAGEVRFTCLSTASGLPDNTIHSIVEDGRGYIWMSSNQGLFRLREDALLAFFRGEEEVVRADIFTRSDGLPDTEFNGGFQPTVLKTDAGRLLFPSANGVAVVDPAEVEAAISSAPILRFESLDADGRELGYDAGLRVPAGTNRVAIRYTGIQLSSPDALRFGYRLDGYDPEDTWIEGGEDRLAVYTSLPPGEYTFEVRGALGGGDWVYAALPFTFAPLVYQTLWFRLGVALTVVALVGSVTASLSRQRFRAELARVEARRALEEERSRISRDMHDEVGASLTEIAILSEIARRELTDPGRAEGRLDRIASSSRDLIDSLGQIVWAINPKHDRLPVLVGYLREHAARYLDVVGVQTRLEFPREVPDVPVSADLRRNAFVILKEALHNVAKHASAEVVRVRLEVAANELRLAVEDDGVGLMSHGATDPDAAGLLSVSSGNGLGNMRKRAADVGGTLEVRAASPRGTSVTLTAPLARGGR